MMPSSRRLQTICKPNHAVSVRRLLTSSPGNPTFATIAKVATALGFRLRMEPIPAEELDDAPVLPAIRARRQHDAATPSKA